MKQTELEIKSLKKEITKMWKLILSQLEKAKRSFINKDIELAREVAGNEKLVDSIELEIENNCENFMALYSPVAIDLRLALSIIKISNTLERIGDFATGIARHVTDEDCNDVVPQLIEDLQIEKMFDILMSMLSDALVAFKSEDTKALDKIMTRDDGVDKIYAQSLNILTNYLQENTAHIYCGLKILLLIRKLERIGDHCNNLAEEIAFYVDAKVLKHAKAK